MIKYDAIIGGICTVVNPHIACFAESERGLGYVVLSELWTDEKFDGNPGLKRRALLLDPFRIECVA